MKIEIYLMQKYLTLLTGFPKLESSLITSGSINLQLALS